MKRAALLLLALSLFTLGGTIAAQAGQTGAGAGKKPSAMRISIVRSAAAGCEPNCAEWISAEGEITAATPAQLRKVLKAAGGRKLPFIITSPGGDVAAGYAMGRLIRRAGLDVTVGRTMLAPCAPEQKECSDTTADGRRGWANNVRSFCNSAYVFVLAGGVARHAYWVSQIGVHQFASTRTMTRWRATTRNGRVIRREILSVSRIAVKTPQVQYDGAARYFDEMGIDPSINELVQLASSKDIDVMDRRELLATKIITDGQDARGQILKLQAALNDSQKAADRVASSTTADVPAGLYEGKAMISHIELRKDMQGAGVSASIASRIGSGPVPAADLVAILRIGNMTPVMSDAADASSPVMLATIRPTAFCALEFRHALTFTIYGRTGNSVTTESVAVSTRRFKDIDALFGAVCHQ